MTLGRKLVLFALAAGVLPLVGVAFAVLRGAEGALGARIAAEQQQAARAAAAGVAQELDRLQRDVTSVGALWDPARLGERELRGLLVVLSRQVPHATAAAVVDATGSARALVAGGAPAAAPGPGEAAFVDAVRAARPGAAGTDAVLAVFDDPRAGPQLAAVVGRDANRAGRWLVAARVDLDLVRAPLDAAAGSAGAAVLLDARGGVLAASSRAGGPAPGPAELDALRAAPGGSGLVHASGGPALAAIAPVPDGGGWSVLMRLPASEAFAPVARLRRAVLGASAAVLAAVLALAWALARGLGGGLARIDAAARALGEGHLAVRVREGGADEIGQVARTFNAMADELQRSRARLERWNEDLRAEVDARTAELRAAQAALLEAQKLAAIGQLGAGVAHEINNPLTGILGNAQLLLERVPEGDEAHAPLAAIESLARRCRDVTEKLLRFSQQRAEPAFEELDLNRVVGDALALADGQVRGEGIGLAVSLAVPSPRVRGDAGHLGQIVLNLLANARTACAGRPARTIRVSTAADGAEAEVAVEDDGKGIAPDVLPRIFEPFFTTKDQWSNVGLGLSVAYRIAAEHGGRIDVRSRVGEGSRFVLRLPAAGGEARA